MDLYEKKEHYEAECFPIYNQCNSPEEKMQYKTDWHKHEQFCVEELLEAILKAERKVSEDYKKKCSSCKESIEDLFEEHKRPQKNTIPFILYCGCEPFKATGVTTCQGYKEKKFLCITSYIFKIKALKDHCAELELLTFKSKKDGDKKLCSPCDQINHECVNNLLKTGICINIDLSCFSGITICLLYIYNITYLFIHNKFGELSPTEFTFLL